jgi:hypothetical protein
MLFENFDGAIQLAGDAGLTVAIGFQHENMHYPLKIDELEMLARRPPHAWHPLAQRH